jgi:hypothetical protein
MRSLIIIEVEHGEDTDALEGASREIQSYINGFDYFQDEGLSVVDWSVRVDLPECFRLA